MSPTFADTDWARIVACYDALLTIEPSPTIAVGRCVAVSYVAGAAAGLADLDEVIAIGGLERYPYAHAARATMLDRLGQSAEAARVVDGGGVERSDRRRASLLRRARRRRVIRSRRRTWPPVTWVGWVAATGRWPLSTMRPGTG